MANPSASSRTLRAGLAALSVILAACSPQIATHGNMVDIDAFARIEPGRTDQSTVLSLLGSPSSQAGFGEPTWYYIGQRTERLALYRPRTIERRVIYVDFEPTGKVRSIGQLDLEDGRKIVFVDRETPTAGQRVTLLKQLVGNIGRFNVEE